MGSVPRWLPESEWLVFWSLGSDLWRVRASGADLEGLTTSSGHSPEWSPDGTHVYFLGDGDKSGNIWSVSVESGEEQQMTDLIGRRGRLGFGFATDGQHFYFPWEEDTGDIWVMDVVQDGGSDD